MRQRILLQVVRVTHTGKTFPLSSVLVLFRRRTMNWCWRNCVFVETKRESFQFEKGNKLATQPNDGGRERKQIVELTHTHGSVIITRHLSLSSFFFEVDTNTLEKEGTANGAGTGGWDLNTQTKHTIFFGFFFFSFCLHPLVLYTSHWVNSLMSSGTQRGDPYTPTERS